MRGAVGVPGWERLLRRQTRTPAPRRPVPPGAGALCPFSRPWRASEEGFPVSPSSPLPEVLVPTGALSPRRRTQASNTGFATAGLPAQSSPLGSSLTSINNAGGAGPDPLCPQWSGGLPGKRRRCSGEQRPWTGQPCLPGVSASQDGLAPRQEGAHALLPSTRWGGGVPEEPACAVLLLLGVLRVAHPPPLAPGIAPGGWDQADLSAQQELH